MTSAFYERGATPFFASQYDQRLHYCRYVPRDLEDSQAPLVVVQHGTGRTAATYRDLMRSFADTVGAVVLAPLLPTRLLRRGPVHSPIPLPAP
jgi:poly(3-hydroxybutyrate) depolymerase